MLQGAEFADAEVLGAALGAHQSPLNSLYVLDTPELDEPAAFAALVDGAFANRLASYQSEGGGLSPHSVPSLARLLTGSALTSLIINGRRVQLLDRPAAALLGGVLRTNTTLHTLCLEAVQLWSDPLAAVTLLTSLVAHPSLRELDLSCNPVTTDAAAESAGAILFALVAANAPALQTLYVPTSGLGDAVLGPLMDALPRNTHLRKLLGGYVNLADPRYVMTEAFARERMLPAIRANTSLLSLHGFGVWDAGQQFPAAWDAMNEVMDIVRRRAAERQLD
jgi:hypothetical protein